MESSKRMLKDYPSNIAYSLQGSSIKEYSLAEGEDWTVNSNCNHIIFFISGNIIISMDKSPLKKLVSKQMLFVRANAECSVTALKKTQLIIINTGISIKAEEIFFCNRTEKEFYLKKEQLYTCMFLEFCPLISNFIATLKNSIYHNFLEASYIDIKIRELLLLIDYSYSDQQRLNFYLGIYASDKAFFRFILYAYPKAKSVSHLAEMSYYSLAGFQKRFKKVFKMSVSRWLKNRRIADIYNEICADEKTLQQISSQYRFSSLTHFKRFCKINFGAFPEDLNTKSSSQKIHWNPELRIN